MAIVKMVNDQTSASAAVEAKLASFLRSLSDEEMDRITDQSVYRIRRAVARHRNQLSAYRVELSESRRILVDSKAKLAKELEAEKSALRSKQVEAIAEVQRRVVALRNRVRSYTQAIPQIEATIERLEQEQGPA